MSIRLKYLFTLFLLGSCGTQLMAVKVGDARESVIAELGQPQSRMAAGQREFLNYAGGRVEITAGVVSEVRGNLSQAAPVRSDPPKASSREPSPAVSPRVRTVHWWTNLAQAKARAKQENKRILALFTGSDWCPPCRQFESEVAHDEQFAGIFNGSFVFFKNDWLRNTPQPKVIEAEVARVRREYGIRQYPTLKVLNSDGEVLGEVNWTEIRGGSFKEIMIEAIDNTRKATKNGKVQDKGWWPF